MTKGSAKVTLPSDNQILITREFAAPRHLVYKAYTTPDLVEKWWHAGHGTMKACEIDLRVGGKYRFAMDAFNGMEVAFRGEFKEIVPDERIVSTEEYEGAPGAIAINEVTLEERDGKTFLKLLATHQSKEIRDMVLQSGMESGLQVAFDLLDELAATLG